MTVFNSSRITISIIKKKIIPDIWARTIIIGNPVLQEVNTGENTEKIESEYEKPSLSTCLKYMKSKAYKNTYGDKPVWHIYVRNFKGPFPPKTRRSCLKSNGKYTTGNPCPICRDIYLQPHYLNIDLIKQFISPGEYIYESKLTGVCQKQQLALTAAIQKARNYGFLTFHVPHRPYNYKFYKKLFNL